MHPAPSVIAFTSLSGIGFGMLFWLGIGLPEVTGGLAFAAFALAFALAVGGLLASTFHLGHPERAVLAFTQWRSSWLSREGWASVLALIVMAITGFAQVFMGTRLGMVGLIGAALSILTVYTTSMIYAQLKTVPRWHQWATPVYFVSFSLAGGALFLGQATIAAILLILAAVAQLAHWYFGDQQFAASGTTLATATGLGDRGAVRAFEPPHTGTNYLLKEFVYKVGRDHARKLRWIAGGLGFALPLILLLIGSHPIIIGLAACMHLAGVLASRWLFFAEAEHVVGLYYGQR